MSKLSKAKAKARRRSYAKPSAPRVIGANDNVATANDNAPPVTIRGVTLTEGQAYRFALAESKLASDSLDVRRDGHRMFEALEREIETRIQLTEAEANLEELKGLEALRGLKIGASKQSGSAGAPRAERDGLETLLTAGSITNIQHAAGLQYRKDYEMLDPERGLTPLPWDQSRNITRGGDGFAKKRTEREEFVRDLEQMIQEEDRTCRGALGRSDVERVGRAVWAMREIAGKGSNLMSLTGSGSVRAATTAGLLIALDCAAIAYGLE